MDCPICQALNPRDAEACLRCGQALAVECPRCGHLEPVASRFCPDCGAKLDGARVALPGPAAVSTWDRGDPPQPGGAPAERRQLTVLFADLVGSVARAARMDPEDWVDTLVSYQRVATEVVEQFGGRVTQYLGDGVMACFGYPTAHEDDPERAVRAGLGLSQAVRGLHRANAGQPPDVEPLRVRVGIHTGLTVVSESDGQISIYGDTPNITARLQSFAKPETVLVTGVTKNRIGERFLFEEWGEREFKGVSDPVSVHRVVRPRRVQSTAEVAARGLAPFVGRERELSALLEAWDAASGGNGSTAVVRSEPGVGKSRLALQLKHCLTAKPHAWLECRCTPFAQGTVLRPFADLLEEALAWSPGDGPAQRLAKLEGELRRWDLPAGEMLPLLSEFLGLRPDAGYAPVEMSAGFKRFGILNAVTQWLLRASRERPVLLLVEDLQWCDPSSLDLIGHLVRQAPKARLLLLGTARPEFEIPWATEPHVAVLSLARLVRPEAERLLAGVDTGSSLPSEVIDAIVDRADGVPLYLEELTKTVLESEGSASRRPTIPATLQDSLTARLDRLSSAREVAQRTAVLGREFSYELAQASTDLPEAALRFGLERLVAAGIVIPKGEPPDTSYQFKHALFQESAYGSLLRRTRRELHARVVRALLDRFPERAAASPELVARHAEAAGLADLAIRYYQGAGRQAQERSANQEAVGHLERAIALIGEIDGAKRDRRELELQLLLGAALTGARGYAHPERLAAFERARELAEAMGDRTQLAVARIGIAIAYATGGRNDEALALGALVSVEAEKDGDKELILHANYQLGHCEYLRGRFAVALQHCEKAIEVYDPELHHRSMFSLGGDTGIAALAHATWSLWHLGYPDRALARAKYLHATAEQLGYPFGIGFSKGTLALVHWLRRDPAAMRAEAGAQREIGERYGFPFHAGVGQALHGAARVLLGDADGMAEAKSGIALSSQSGIGINPMFIGLLAEVQTALGEREQALAVVESALVTAAEAGMPYWSAELHRLKGELLIALESAEVADERVRAEFAEALRIARDQGSRMCELRAATSLARVMIHVGQGAEARAQLGRVYAGFDEGFELADLREARALLEEIGS